jgi:hypothetical protein
MRSIASAALAVVMCVSSLAAHAAVPPPPAAGYTAEAFDFFCVGAACALTPPIGDQLFVQVIRDADAVPDDPNVYLKFWNLIGTKSSVVYVSIQGINGISRLGGSGTDFGAATSTPLPGGNSATPPFVADVSFVAIPGGGINTVTDNLELVTSSATFEQVMAGIQSRAVRFGLYVTDFPGLEVAATYISAASPVPEPATSILLLGGLWLTVMMARRRSRSACAKANFRY